jgi:hypothetical protein
MKTCFDNWFEVPNLAIKPDNEYKRIVIYILVILENDEI